MMPIPKVQLSLLLTSLALGGCASTGHNPKDPFESFNRGMYQFNDTVVKPVAKGYNAVVPTAGKMMISNVFSNLNDVIVAANDLLQLKIVQAVSDTGRIVVNTTVGLYGLADVATMVGLKKHNEDFGLTLGYWGISSGPYLVWPVLGARLVGGSVGLYVDSRTRMMRKMKHVNARNDAYVVDYLSQYAALLDRENLLNEAAIDRYAFMRDAYLQHRQSLVYDGNPPREKYDDEEEDSKPDKRSPNDKDKSVQPPTTEAAPVAVPVVVETLPIESPVAAFSTEPSATTPAVWRVWVSQREGIR